MKTNINKKFLQVSKNMLLEKKEAFNNLKTKINLQLNSVYIHNLKDSMQVIENIIKLAEQDYFTIEQNMAEAKKHIMQSFSSIDENLAFLNRKAKE
jgi:hypothetical protein